MPSIHATAIVDRTAELAEGVTIDAYAIVGAGVSIGAGTTIGSHSVVQGPTAIGGNCTIGPAAYVGLEPQHLEFLRRPPEVRQQSWLVIGDGTIIRESASVHRASKAGRENATRVGNQCLLMGGSHIAHDCVVADHVTMANGALLAGHCNIGPRAFLGGSCALHQFGRIGRLAMIAGNESIGRDVPPFAAMFHGGLKGYNAVGCRRAGVSREAIKAIRKTYYCYHSNRTMNGVLAAITDAGIDGPEVREILEFFKSTRRGIQPSVRFLNYLRSSDGEDE
ncbi:MAG TPA: acyl-ACP--UDP-N-acetylglucosamine O-acyltransferase [Humisphaera sp.]|jgi:UDP-N-acetylglucosamine acyltransferase|nr:acyl-ACP--UDP-N-acetylglucosamine O-acyltransferase [Humisphaera sp.]